MDYVVLVGDAVYGPFSGRQAAMIFADANKQGLQHAPVVPLRPPMSINSQAQNDLRGWAQGEHF